MFTRFKNRRLTLSGILQQHYFPYARVSERTASRYRCELNRWNRIVGAQPISRLKTEHFLDFREECLRRRLSASSIEGSIKVVKILLRFAKDRGWIVSLPMTGKPLPLEEPEPDPATLQELCRLYRAAHHATYPGRHSVSPADWFRAFIVIELWTGIRGQDLIWRFAWKHIRKDSIRFRASKTSKRHVFPHHAIVTEHLKLVHGMDDDRVLACKTLNRVNSELASLCQIAGIRKLTSGHIREACFTQWTIAGETAGKIVHGCGIPTVLRRHYLGRLQILEEAAPRFRWPEAISNGHQSS